jgi:parvulin-like peptidyl-prolyl isomerase
MCLLLCLTLLGCNSNSQKLSIMQPAPDTQSTAKQPPVTPSAASGSIQTVAKIGNTRINLADLTPAMIEASGGQVLSEKVLTLKLKEKLGKTIITQDQIQAERSSFVKSLHDNPQLAEQLLAQLRQREGLGPKRFEDFLFRQAALRYLVQSDVVVTDAAIQQAYELKFGPTSVIQVLTVDNPTTAVKILNRARQGEDFGKLVQEFSQNQESKAFNGMLEPISPADASYPSALHKAIARLQVGQISDVVALENGFAILKLLSKNPRQSVTLDDVKASLAEKVRRDVEQMLMRQLASTLLTQTDVVVLDRDLNQSWQAARRNLPLESAKP